MNWTHLLERRVVTALPPDHGALRDLWLIAERSLQNASIDALTEDGRFFFAYMAVRTLTTIAVRVEGFRITSRGGAHFNTFEALRAVPAPSLSDRADYFDDCRRKRNETAYEALSVSRTEADALLAEARAFRADLAAWMERTHPEWTPNR